MVIEMIADIYDFIVTFSTEQRFAGCPREPKKKEP